MPNNPIPALAEVANSAKPEVVEANKAVEYISGLVVNTNEMASQAVTMLGAVKSKHAEVKAKRDSFIDPLNKVIKDVKDFFKPALTSLETAEQGLKSKVSDHFVEAGLRRDALLAQVAQTADPTTRGNLISKATALNPPKIDGLSIREPWTGEVSDSDALVRWAIQTNRTDLLIPNAKVLTALTKSAGKDPQIPGWKAICKRSAVITVSKIKGAK